MLTVGINTLKYNQQKFLHMVSKMGYIGNYVAHYFLLFVFIFFFGWLVKDLVDH